jgi:hypothetical protein
MSLTAPELRQAIQQKLDGKLAGPALIRMLAEFDNWMMPNTFMKLGDSTNALLFSDETAYRLAQEKFGTEHVPDEILRLPGSVIFEMIADAVDNFSVNPCSTETISFPKQLLPALKEWGAAVNVERALDVILQAQTEKNWKCIKGFQKYVVPVKEQPDGKALPMGAPDSKGRALLAIFTADDTFNAYVQREHHGEPQAVTYFTGERLFDFIRAFQCDGFVFNCSGPARPAAFARPFADEVLKNG